MSNSIDQRIIEMVFDNKQFLEAVADTQSTLAKLNQSLKLQGATEGLDDVDKAAKGIGLGSIASGIDAISSKFSTMGIIGVATLTNITNKIVDAGVKMAKDFVFDPIHDGFTNYETQINAVQTILANTAAEGTKIGDVNKALAVLNTYANQTVYNFSDMAKNIGTFTAAGVGLQTSVDSIKGIANLAAMSGASSEQASSAMYQLSQAIASGSVKLQDWNSVVNAGLGGKTFQDALITTAKNSGVAIDSIISKAGSFRNSLQSGWLTSDILTKTLTQFTGDLSVAQLKAMGYTDQQAAQIFQMGQTALNAATKIKTMTQLTQALKEEVGTAYAAIFKTVFGDIGQATDLFSGIHNAAENFLTAPIYELNTFLQEWETLGGRTDLITALTYVFDDLGEMMGIVAKAFKTIFPPTTAQTLYNITESFLQLVNSFKIGGKTQDELVRSFEGLFSIISIIVFVIKQLGGQLLALLGYTRESSSGFLSITANIGDFLVKLKNLIENSDGVTEFFGYLGQAMALPINLIQYLVAEVEDLVNKFKGVESSKASDELGNIAKQLTPLAALGKLADDAWTGLITHLAGFITFITPFADKVGDEFKQLGQAIISSIGSLNFNDVLNLIDTGLFGGLILLVKKFVTKFKGGGDSELSGFVDTIKETFEGLTETLETMQTTLKAATLLEIAISVGVLAVSMSVLSKIDQAGLIRSGIAITAMITDLVGSMTIFQKFVGAEDAGKMLILMGSLILLGGAVDVLAGAVKKIAGLTWDQLERGLTGLTTILAELAGTIKLMGSPEGMIASGLGLSAFAKGVDVLATAVIKISVLNWDQMAKGLVGVGGLLASLGLFSKFAESDTIGLTSGAGIILMAQGISILADVMQRIAKMSWQDIAKGLTGVAGGLGIIAGALALIPSGSIFSAAAVLIVAESLGLIGDALQKMSSFSWQEIGKGMTSLAGSLGLIAAALALLPPQTLLSAASIYIVAASLGLITDALVKMGGQTWVQISKGLVELAGALTIIGIAVVFMEESLPGAAAILVVAAALDLLAPVLLAFGNMSWDSIGKSMTMLAGVFIIFGAAAVLLAPLTPILLAIGAAIALLGVGMLAAGAGVLLFSVGLTALSIAGAAGAAAMVAIVSGLIGLLPEVGKEIGLAVVAFATVIATAGPAIVGALTTVLDSLLTTIDKEAPKINTTFLLLLNLLVKDVEDEVPKLVIAGVNLLIGLLNGISNNIGRVGTAATNVITTFIKSIGSNALQVTQAAFTTIITFVNGLAQQCKTDIPQLESAGLNLAKAIVEGMVDGLKNGVSDVAGAAKSLAGSALSSIGNFLDIGSPSKKARILGQYAGQGFTLGIDDSADGVNSSAENLGKVALTSMAKTISGMGDMIMAGVDANPTIKPSLDLTDVKNTASQLSGIMGVKPISVGASYSSAVNASAGYSANQTAVTDIPTIDSPAEFNFTQNNYSPKAISAVDLYRQTNNQLSKARGVLAYQSGGTE